MIRNELLTIDEVAEILRTSPAAVRRMRERNTLPGVVKVGRRVLIRRDDLLASLGLLPSALPKAS